MGSPQSLYPRSLRLRVDLAGELSLGVLEPERIRVIDLSAGGAFIEARARPIEGAEARLVLELPEGSLALHAVVSRAGTALRGALHPELDALVVRASGLGLRFTRMTPEAQRRLDAFLALAREE